MIKIFLVEDEFVVREGIKNNIDWEGNGLEFCGEASDGELALPMIRKCQPDILITDIRMPFMDGLELARLVREEFPSMEIILLTGFEEFDYAKKAISLGVARYLTKPISGDELLAEIEVVSEQIQKRKMEQELRSKFQQEMEENSRKDRNDFFQKLVMEEHSATELLDMAKKLNMDLSAMWYGIVLLLLQSEHHAMEEYSGSQIQAQQRIIQELPQDQVLVFDGMPEGKILLFKGDSEEEVVRCEEAAKEKIEQIMEEYPHVRYFGGIGKNVNRLRELASSYESASHAFAHRFFVPGSKILSFDTIEEMEMTGKDAGHLAKDANASGSDLLDVTQVNLKQIDKRRVMEFLKTGNRGEVSYFIEEFFREIGSASLESMMFRQYIAMDVFFCAAMFAEELGHGRDELNAPDPSSEVLRSVEGTKEYLTDMLDAVIVFRETATGNRFNEVVDQAIQYIEERYGDEELSLNTLAASVNVSPNYLSTIFAQQTGQTFIRYLTDYRMGKARELLKCTSKRSSEIGLEVGYRDPHYFSYIFKKAHGMTPTQYREGKGEE